MANAQVGTALRHIRKLIQTRTAEQLPDQQLLGRFVSARDEAAFTELVRRHGALVRGVCERILRHAQDAEDAFQATLLVFARKAHAIRKQESVGSWLYGVAYRIAQKAKMNAAARHRHESRVAVPTLVQPPADVSWREFGQILDEELERLPEKYRAPLLLCYLEGKTQDEAARQLGWTPGTLRGRLDRGREHLRRRLTQRGVTFSLGLCATLLAQKTAAAVPPSRATTIIHAATECMSSQATSAGGISPQAAALAEGAMQAMFLTKLKCTLVLVLLVSMLGAGAGVLTHQALADKAESAPKIDAQKVPVTEKKPATDGHGGPLPAGAAARLGTVRFRHGGPIATAAYSPDSKILASGSWDWSIKLWDLATGKELHHLKGHRGWVWSVAFSPDGKTLASGGDSRDRTIRIWDISTGNELLRLEGHQGSIVSVAFSPDGKTLASSGSDGTVRLWNPAAGQELRRLQGQGNEVARICFSPDGKTLAGAGSDAVIRLWDVATGQETLNLQGHQEQVASVAFSPDGKTLASGSFDRTIRLWDVATGQEVSQFQGHRNLVWSVAFSPDGKTLVSGSGNSFNSLKPGTPGEVWLWEVATGKVLHRFQDVGAVRTVAFAPDGKTVAAPDYYSIVHLWDVKNGKELFTSGSHPGWIGTVRFSPDGKTLATAGADRTIRIWDRATRQELRRLGEGLTVLTALAYSPNGQGLASGGVDNVVRLWDLASGKELRQLNGHAGLINAVAFSPDGKRLVSGSDDRTLILWDVATGEELRRFTGHQEIVESVAFSPDGRFLASGSNDSSIRLWDVAAGTEIRQWQGHQNLITHLAFSADGRSLVSSGRDGGIRLWETATGKERRTLVPALQGKAFSSCAFSPDLRIVAGSTDMSRILRFWDVLTGKELGAFQGHQGYIKSIAFSPDGKQVVTGSEDTTALIWDVSGLPSAQPAVVDLTNEEAQTLWSRLLTDDAAEACGIMGQLASAPRQILPILRKHLQPVGTVDAQQVSRLLADLDSDHFNVREKASAALEKLGEPIEAELRKVLDGQPSAEVRRRVERLLVNFQPANLSGERLRITRAMEVLEALETTDARELLQTLAKGAAGASLTQDAKAALDRLAKRSVPKP
jgi:RNA polymerase sigma factor (sigma-70 family)